MRVLLVEDDDAIAEPLAVGLARYGFQVSRIRTGAEALAAPPHEVVLLDLGLPDLDGIDVCRQLRATSAVPIIVITARSEEVDRVLGLELGADDYVVKPFGFRELVARIRAVIRRSTPEPKPKPVKVGDLEIDRRRFEVTMQGRPVALTLKEFELLATLAAEPGRVFGREELLDLVWGREGFVEPRTVDVHLARLRGKFVGAKLSPPDVETVRGVGYRLREPM